MIRHMGQETSMTGIEPVALVIDRRRQPLHPGAIPVTHVMHSSPPREIFITSSDLPQQTVYDVLYDGIVEYGIDESWLHPYADEHCVYDI
jgi:hypothetical protein